MLAASTFHQIISASCFWLWAMPHRIQNAILQLFNGYFPGFPPMLNIGVRSWSRGRVRQACSSDNIKPNLNKTNTETAMHSTLCSGLRSLLQWVQQVWLQSAVQLRPGSPQLQWEVVDFYSGGFRVFLAVGGPSRLLEEAQPRLEAFQPGRSIICTLWL